MKEKKVALIILDGWGYGNQDNSDAIFQANTAVFDRLIASHPNSTLKTYGEFVGLPSGQMGNSEVGHLNIGAGRVVYQDLVKINRAIENDELSQNKVLLNALKKAKAERKNVHLMGLVSNGGIHSHQSHLNALLDICKEEDVPNVYVHAFTDGRDTDPHSGKEFLSQLQEHIAVSTGKLVSVIGRYYAMDRDQRWERIKEAYDLLLNGRGKATHNLIEAVQESYDEGVSDEFIKPIYLADQNDEAIGRLEDDDLLICFNFRTDRCRQICRVLSQEDFEDHQMKTVPLDLVTMTTYDENFKGIEVLFEKDNLKNTLGEVISNAGKTQVRIAETEKYPHVTFFFSGGREQSFKGEDRILIPSPKVATYDLQPEMSAEEVTQNILESIDKNQPDFICLNFANPDMVGHTGVFPAIKQAVEKVDECLGRICEKAQEKDYSLLIIADHGNADCAVNPDGSPNTAHTVNPVPIILIDKDKTTIKDGKLADVAPTILELMGIEAPKEMDGKVLV
ncbi:MAG: phosphoglycerate mutase (2,3-diphosphoglycerate-independent) [Flavobacteriales bacterium]|nr:phosphoglycerate mutase (2,3-diphosphoglycerate-independent) [Flavobacteriales bacterium]